MVFIAFIAGNAYGFVAIPAQTQLQEDLPEDVRGRVFGVLNMLVSAASFIPIIIVGPISDVIGTAAVILVVAIAVLAVGVASVFKRDPSIGMSGASADPHAEDPLAAALGADRPTWRAEPGVPASPYQALPDVDTVSGLPKPNPGPIPEPVDSDVTRVVGPADPADRD